ncbi:MAG: FkbM family methyltransferase [Bryobacteraceae bacterium]
MKALVQSILRPFGLRLTRLPKGESGVSALFSVLKRFGFSPAHIIDVGANHGDYTRIALQFFPDAQYTLLEPQDHLKAHVQDLIEAGHRIQWVNAGASDRSGTLPFHVSHRDDSSTFTSTEGDTSPAIAIEVLSLDDLLVRNQLPLPDLVKIDAEGFDMKVLRGATTLLGKTEVFLLEASILCPFENTLASAVQFMAEHGYRLIDITDTNRSPRDNVLWLTELAFLRKDSSLFSAVTSYE